MLATKALVDRMATLLAADVTTLAEVALIELHLSKTAFTPGPIMVPGDFTEADFDGYAPIPVASAVAQVFNDPVTGDRIIQLNEPAGGWSFETTGVTNLPQTIFGAFLTDAAGAVVHGCERLPADIELTATDQGFSLPNIRFRLNQSALT